MDKIGTKNNWKGKPKLFPCSLLLFPVLSTLNLFASSHTVYIAALLSITVIRHRSQCITNSSIYKQNIDNKQLVGNAQVSLNLPSYFTYVHMLEIMSVRNSSSCHQLLFACSIALQCSLLYLPPTAQLQWMAGKEAGQPSTSISINADVSLVTCIFYNSVYQFI